MVKSAKKKHSYPPFWDKFIPYFLGAISMAIVGLIIVALAVVMGFLPVR